MEMIVRHSPGARRITLGADKGYDAAAFVDHWAGLKSRMRLRKPEFQHPARAFMDRSSAPGEIVKFCQEWRWQCTVQRISRPFDGASVAVA
jgi:hypothetical protein